MPFADELIGAPAIRALVTSLRAVTPRARLPRLSAVEAALAPLALRERSDLIRDALLADLPGDYASFAKTVRAAAEKAPSFTGWLIWPVTSAVAAKAIDEGGVDAFDDALALLAELTPRLTSEFALRGLLNADLGRALGAIQHWTRSESADVRRLASEGTRPVLPWAIRVPGILADPKATLPILDALYRDESEYVRRSVANHLNDISRNDPDLVVETAGAWLAAPDDNTARLVRHALRTLVKQGNPGALALLGFTSADLDVTGPVLGADTVAIGETLFFTGSIRNLGQEPARLVIDYVVHHLKANGTLTGKTFKLTTRTVEPGETYELSREHSFRVITTRRYHPGRHAVELQVNGVRSGRAEFTVVAG